MHYAFFGTPEFAAIILEKLILAGYPPAILVCNPDRPQGRKNIVTPPPTKQRIMNYELRFKEQIKILQPEKLTNSILGMSDVLKIDDVNVGDIRHPKIKTFDFAIVAAYAKILPNEIIQSFPKGVIGVHPSLLPLHRGPAPIQYTILEGDPRAGTTLFLLDKSVDHGPILAQRELKSYRPQAMSYELLLTALANLSAELLIDTLPKFANGEIIPVRQDDAQATFTKKITTEDAYIPIGELENAMRGKDSKSAKKVHRKILALNPEPGTWTMLKNKRVKLLESEIKNEKLNIKKIQVEGKRPRVTTPSDFQYQEI